MDDQKPLLEELRQIKERLGRIESNTNWLLTVAEFILLFLVASAIARFFHW
jgi:hypothetical protein